MRFWQMYIGGSTLVEIPVTSQLISVKSQNDIPVAYFLIRQDPGSSLNGVVMTSHFYTVGTGRSFTVDDGMRFVETHLLMGEVFVLHVFQVIQK